jgi:hypothetical protein
MGYSESGFRRKILPVGWARTFARLAGEIEPAGLAGTRKRPGGRKILHVGLARYPTSWEGGTGTCWLEGNSNRRVGGNT